MQAVTVISSEEVTVDLSESVSVDSSEDECETLAEAIRKLTLSLNPWWFGELEAHDDVLLGKFDEVAQNVFGEKITYIPSSIRDEKGITYFM